MIARTVWWCFGVTVSLVPLMAACFLMDDFAPAPKDVKGSEMEGRVERGSGLTAARTPWWSRVSLGVVLTAETASSVPGWGTKVPQATCHGQKTNKQTNPCAMCSVSVTKCVNPVLRPLSCK